MSTRRALTVGWFLVASCGPTEGGAPSGAPPTSTPTATSSTAAPSAKAPPFDLAGYCGEVCKRATTCGLEPPTALAQKGDKTDAAALTSAQAQAPEVEKRCLEQCNASKIDDSREKADAAKGCVAEKDCAGFAKCLEALAR
jgi:hypothetical protein